MKERAKRAERAERAERPTGSTKVLKAIKGIKALKADVAYFVQWGGWHTKRATNHLRYGSPLGVITQNSRSDYLRR